MVARRPITEGTWLAKIPRTAVLCCGNSRMCGTLKCDGDLYPQLSELTSWLPLILSLLYEQDKKVLLCDARVQTTVLVLPLENTDR